MPTFAEAKLAFDEGPGKLAALPTSLVPVHGKYRSDIALRTPSGAPLEEYYRWQFLSALINSGLYSKDHIGCEVQFPKGSAGSSNLRVDAVIFDDEDWITHYNAYWAHKTSGDLQWLNEHLVAVIEFKRGHKSPEEAWIRQVKPAMREKEPATAFVLGIYYDEGRLFLFERQAGKFLRYDEKKNVGTDFSLHLPDPYAYIPGFSHLRGLTESPILTTRSGRSIRDLEVITSIDSLQVRDALSQVLRILDKVGLVNQRGYEILVQTFALKIFDEKRNEKKLADSLRFYVDPAEIGFKSLAEQPAQTFIERMKTIQAHASAEYERILSNPVINWKDSSHIRIIMAVCENFQDYSFVRSSKSDLYQLVFYNFANRFQQQEKAQFLTPLRVIDFLVKIVNPRSEDSVCDPCCGIGDFLSLSFINSLEKPAAWQLDDGNLYGLDVSKDMITLASLNMLLNGDGNAHLYTVPDQGSILWKLRSGAEPSPVELLPDFHSNGTWDNWPDDTKLFKFDVILTNPPFGDDRAFRPRTEVDRQVIESYETWGLGGRESLDLGVVFLENAVRSLKVGGRLGIVLSNSIASTDRWAKVREWLLSKVRLVAAFDLPPNVFAETGVNTTILVAYIPEAGALDKLRQENYSVFIRDIKNVGYTKRTSRRNVVFQDVYLIDDTTFEIATDNEGHPILHEDFTKTIGDFRSWALGQEGELRRLFLSES